MGDIKSRLMDDIKAAMRAKDTQALTTLRGLHAAIKQKEIDQRLDGDLDDNAILQTINTLVKQRRESAEQYRNGNRPELAENEEREIIIYQNYLPEQLSDGEVEAAVDEAIAESGADNMQAMGPLMAILKPKLQGRADMSKVSQLVKNKLS